MSATVSVPCTPQTPESLRLGTYQLDQVDFSILQLLKGVDSIGANWEPDSAADMRLSVCCSGLGLIFRIANFLQYSFLLRQRVLPNNVSFQVPPPASAKSW
jgi:hypothetical protein